MMPANGIIVLVSRDGRSKTHGYGSRIGHGRHARQAVVLIADYAAVGVTHSGHKTRERGVRALDEHFLMKRIDRSVWRTHGVEKEHGCVRDVHAWPIDPGSA